MGIVHILLIPLFLIGSIELIQGKSFKKITRKLDSTSKASLQKLFPDIQLRLPREKRTVLNIEETILPPAVEEPNVVEAEAEERQLRPMRGRPRPPFGGPIGPSIGMGCTPFSCIRKCSPRCDSLCSKTGECFCSCPEDETIYEYYDPPSPPFFTESVSYY